MRVIVVDSTSKDRFIAVFRAEQFTNVRSPCRKSAFAFRTMQQSAKAGLIQLKGYRGDRVEVTHQPGSSLPRPPCRRRVHRADLRRPKRDQMAPLVGIATDLRAILAAHVAFQLMNRRRLRSPHDVERDGLMGVAAKAFHFEVAIPCIARRRARAMAAPDPESPTCACSTPRR